MNSDHEEEDYDDYDWIWLPPAERERLNRQLDEWYRNRLDAAFAKMVDVNRIHGGG